MEHTITPELISICKKIVQANNSVEEWSAIESSDMFQTEHYCGGFDATELEFSFSLYEDGREYWFQFSLVEAVQITKGIITKVTASQQTS